MNSRTHDVKLSFEFFPPKSDEMERQIWVAVEAPKTEAAAAPVAAAGANHVFKLPDVGEGTAEAELVGWHVKVGDAVQEDQILAEVMTDKATVELTSPVSGVVVALLMREQAPSGPCRRTPFCNKYPRVASPRLAKAPAEPTVRSPASERQ